MKCQVTHFGDEVRFTMYPESESEWEMLRVVAAVQSASVKSGIQSYYEVSQWIGFTLPVHIAADKGAT